ncbi:MAG: hypothetical protein GXY19_07735 [Phycisphaerae bacterium]|nr:hypothetical protein [Phycisphaerae bacterium]
MRRAGLVWLALPVLFCGCKRQPPGDTPAIHKAVSSGSLSQVRSLLAHGANPNARNRHGWTPPHVAARQGHATMLELLLKHGADPDAQGGPEGPALHSAILYGHLAAVRKLIAGGADVNLRDASPNAFHPGMTPLHCVLLYASSTWRDEMVRRLLSAGADPRQPTDVGDTVLHRAAIEGLIELSDLFISHGADVNARNARGSTPVHEAVWWSRVEMASFLLDHGADVNIADNVGDTPLHVAACNGYEDCFALLRERKADLEARNDLGLTPAECMRPADEPNMIVLHADGHRPYEVIITRPVTVRGFLISHGIEFDRVWTPDSNDIASLDLEAAIKAGDPIATRDGFYVVAVLEYLPHYAREYGGFLRGGRKYLLCNAQCADEYTTPRDGFTTGMDGGCCEARIVVDLEGKVVTWGECNGS